MLRFSKSKHLENRFLFFCCLFFLTFTLVLFISSENVYSFDVTLTWDENSDPELAGYKIFSRQEGQNYNYASPAWTGTEETCTIDNLDEAIIYYFVARAYNTSGAESDDSNELTVEVINGEIIINTFTDSGVENAGGCFIETGASDL